MTDQVLNILKFVLLGLLYLFFARVLWAVWSEVRAPRRSTSAQGQQLVGRPPRGEATTPSPRPAAVAAASVDDATSRRGRAARAARNGPAGRLVVLEPKHRRGTTIGLAQEITVGRDEHCTLTIDDDTFVSQLHLRVYDYEGQPMVEDLGSTNGTFHNGNRLHGSRLLHPGDRIQVGTTVIEAQ
jgi:pSer/pThr/pTyr-binding forkhead associated (FHA) protein